MTTNAATTKAKPSPPKPLGLAGLAPLGLVLAPSLMHLGGPPPAPPIAPPVTAAAIVASRCVKNNLTQVHEVADGKQDVVWHLRAGTRVQVVGGSTGWARIVYAAFGDPQPGWLKEGELVSCP